MTTADSIQGIHVDSVHKTFKAKAVKLLWMSIAVRREQMVKALDGVSLAIQPGEAVGIIGPNGAGKTTLMGCLLGFLKPDSGVITIDGRKPNTLEVRRKIGYVPERLNFQRAIKLRELLEMHYDLAAEPRQSRDKRVEELLETVGLDKEKWTLPVEKCSRGMLQRLALAQALVGKPKYLFLDEPTSGIDPGGVLELTELLMKIKGMGMSLVLNSHQLDQVQVICDRVVFVRRGKISTEEDFEQVALDHTLYLRFASVLDASQAQKLQEIADALSLNLIDFGADKAQFVVRTDEDNLRLIKQLVDGGFPLVEVAPQHSKLERMFLSNSRESFDEPGDSPLPSTGGTQ